jgi:hypothetical protein
VISPPALVISWLVPGIDFSDEWHDGGHQDTGITRATETHNSHWHHREREGRPMDIAALAELLHETADHHGAFEAVAPPHDWWDWYAAYMDARERGSTPEAASAAAGRYMADVKHIVV